MIIQWLGEYRDLVEALICFANNYISIHNQEFIGEDCKLSFSQIQIVEYLLENEEHNQKMSDVAKRIGISASSFTKLGNKLVDKGVLQKYHLQGNKKNIILQVTEKGKKIYNDYAKNIGSEVFKEFLEIGTQLSHEEQVLFTKMIYSLTKRFEWQGNEPTILIAVE